MRIATSVDRALGKLDAHMDALRQSNGLLKEYRQALITAAVTGQIDVTKEDD